MKLVDWYIHPICFLLLDDSNEKETKDKAKNDASVEVETLRRNVQGSKYDSE